MSCQDGGPTAGSTQPQTRQTRAQGRSGAPRASPWWQPVTEPEARSSSSPMVWSKLPVTKVPGCCGLSTPSPALTPPSSLSRLRLSLNIKRHPPGTGARPEPWAGKAPRTISPPTLPVAPDLAHFPSVQCWNSWLHLSSLHSLSPLATGPPNNT